MTITARLEGQKNVNVVEPKRSRVCHGTMEDLPGETQSHRCNITTVTLSLEVERKRDVCPLFSFSSRPKPHMAPDTPGWKSGNIWESILRGISPPVISEKPRKSE